MKIADINDLMLSAHVFCHGVNAGVSASIKLLQKSINAVYGVSIAVDGKIGKQTLTYANGPDINKLINEFISRRISFYTNIAEKNPSQKKFLKGWINRVDSTTKTIQDYCNKDKAREDNVLYADISLNKKENVIMMIIKLIFKLLSRKK